MIDLAALRAGAEGPGSEQVPVTRRFLGQVAKEIEEGRQAKADLEAKSALEGLVFGLAGRQRL